MSKILPPKNNMTTNQNQIVVNLLQTVKTRKENDGEGKMHSFGDNGIWKMHAQQIKK